MRRLLCIYLGLAVLTAAVASRAARYRAVPPLVPVPPPVSLPRTLATDADVDAAIRALHDDRTRLVALERLLEFASWRLSLPNSIIIGSRGDPGLNDRLIRAGKAVDACSDLRTVRMALASPNYLLRA